MSEEDPAELNDPVYFIVGKTFEDVVYANSSFYVPWCDHCKRRKPIWGTPSVSDMLMSRTIIIAKMNATENDLPPSINFRIHGFPTLKFKRAGSREFIDFNGDRSLESLVKFTEANAKNNLRFAP